MVKGGSPFVIGQAGVGTLLDQERTRPGQFHGDGVMQRGAAKGVLSVDANDMLPGEEVRDG